MVYLAYCFVAQALVENPASAGIQTTPPFKVLSDKKTGIFFRPFVQSKRWALIPRTARTTASAGCQPVNKSDGYFSQIACARMGCASFARPILPQPDRHPYSNNEATGP